VVDVRMFRDLNFAISCLMMFSVGVVMFASLVMMPQFLRLSAGI